MGEYRDQEVSKSPNSQALPEDGGPLWRVPAWFKDFSPVELSQLETFHKELLRFNANLNLVSSATTQCADEIHFADCILAARLILSSTESQNIYDIGSGNGFPGIIMAILSPERKFFLVDKDERKSEFLKIVSSRLGLKNCISINQKVEELDEGLIECAVSRAFAPLGNALIMTRKVIASGGEYFHLKNESWSLELSNAPVQVCSLWANELIGEYALPDSRTKKYIIKSKKD